MSDNFPLGFPGLSPRLFTGNATRFFLRTSPFATLFHRFHTPYYYDKIKKDIYDIYLHFFFDEQMR